MSSSFVKRFIFALFMAASVFSGSAAFALVEPRSVGVDHRVRLMTFQPDQVYKFTGHYRYASQIEFGSDETIKTITMGDSTAWMLNPAGNKLFLKPVEQDATTNMTVLTDKHTYLFELHARETDDIDDKEMTFIFRFAYPDGSGISADSLGGGGGTVSRFLDTVPSPDDDPELYNTKYTISGTEDIAPIRIFDDGLFTYFEFRGKNADLPAFYIVNSLGEEAIVNYRTRGNYIVIERVAHKFTLRHGSDIVCVWNEGPVLGPLPTPDQELPSGHTSH